MDYINRLSAAYIRWIDWLERWLTPKSLREYDPTKSDRDSM
jgi:hypothetical protein